MAISGSEPVVRPSLSQRLRAGLRPEHGIVAAVAVAFVALSLAGGGYSTTARAIAALVVWGAVVAGLIFGLFPRGPVARGAVVAGLFIAGLTAFTALSMGWGADDGRAFDDVLRVGLYAGIFALVVLASSPGEPRPWLAGLAIGLAVVACLGVMSRLQPGLFPDQTTLAQLTDTAPRLSYPLGYWNAMGAAMALAATLLAWFGIAGGSRVGRTLATALIPIPLLALLMTSSRGGVLATVLGLAVLFAMWPGRIALGLNLALGAVGGAVLIALGLASQELIDGKLDTSAAGAQGDRLLVASIVLMAAVGAARWLLDGRLSALTQVRLGLPPGVRRAALAAGAVVAVAALIVINPVEKLKSEPSGASTAEPGFATTHFANTTASGRYQFWEAAWDAFKSEPLAGIGAGGYEAYWSQHGNLGLFVRNAHSLYLEALAELGLIGLALLLGFVLLPIVLAVRRRRVAAGAVAAAPILAVLLAAGFAAGIDWMWEVPAAFLPFVVAAALVAGPALSPSMRRPGPLRFVWGGATVLAGWAVIFVAAISLVSDRNMAASRSDVERNELAGATRNAAEAHAIQPWSAEPLLQLALVQERARDFKGANVALNEAAERAPENWRVWLVRARVEWATGNAKPAVRSLHRARALNPRSKLFAGLPARP